MPIVTTVKYGLLSPDHRFDSDYYHPDYINHERLLRKISCAPMSKYAHVSDGNHVSIAEEFCDHGIRYIRGQDLSDFFISDAAPIYIPEETYRRLARSHMVTKDVLIGVVGSIGCVSLVTEKCGKLTGNCKIAILRPFGEMPSEVLAVWLTSEHGQKEIYRRVRGSVQMGVILPDVGSIPVPKFSDTCVKAVVKLVGVAERLHLEGRNLYPQAEAEMLDRLGWEELAKKKPELFYIERLGTVATVRRCDPEFFQPRCHRLRRRLIRLGGAELGELWSSCDKGMQPEEYAADGEVLVVKSKNVGGQGINLAECERTDISAWNDAPTARLTENDLLINATGRGTLGRAAVVPALAGKSVASVDLLICHLNQSKLLPHYAALFLNSPAGIMQSEQSQTGSSGQLHLYPQHVSRFVILVPSNGSGQPDLKWQQRLAEKVKAATMARECVEGKLKAARRIIDDEVRRLAAKRR